MDVNLEGMPLEEQVTLLVSLLTVATEAIKQAAQERDEAIAQVEKLLALAKEHAHE